MKISHISSLIHKSDIVLEVNQTLSLRNSIDSDIELIQSVLKDMLSTLVNMTLLSLHPHLIMVVFVESSPQLVIQFIHILHLVLIFVFNLVLDLKANLLVRLLHPVFFCLLVINLLLTSQQIQSVFLAYIPIL